MYVHCKIVTRGNISALGRVSASTRRTSVTASLTARSVTTSMTAVPQVCLAPCLEALALAKHFILG